MYKPLIAALLLAACAHAPAAVPAPPPAPAAELKAPCVAEAPLNLREHPMAAMVPPVTAKETAPDGEVVPVTTLRILAPSLIDFVLSADALNDWAQATWKACRAGAR